MILKNGIPIDPKYRQVKIKYNEVRVCYTCGTLEHFRCNNPQRCIKCGLTDHLTASCTIDSKKQRCLNCHRLNHRCDSEECNPIRIKKYKVNDYILSILLGENIIRDQSEILKNPEAEKNEKQFDEEQIKELVDEAINKNERINKMDDRLSLQEEKVKVIEAQIQTLSDNQMEMITQITDLREDLKTDNR
jgi:hypothetical protein